MDSNIKDKENIDLKEESVDYKNLITKIDNRVKTKVYFLYLIIIGRNRYKRS